VRDVGVVVVFCIRRPRIAFIVHSSSTNGVCWRTLRGAGGHSALLVVIHNRLDVVNDVDSARAWSACNLISGSVPLSFQQLSRASCANNLRVTVTVLALARLETRR
jgi:hypothetical protein